MHQGWLWMGQDVDVHCRVHLREANQVIELVCVFCYVEEAGPEEKPAEMIIDEDWGKIEQTLSDLEKATKQGESVLQRQDRSQNLNKELTELIDKLEKVIDGNKEVEVTIA